MRSAVGIAALLGAACAGAYFARGDASPTSEVAALRAEVEAMRRSVRELTLAAQAARHHERVTATDDALTRSPVPHAAAVEPDESAATLSEEDRAALSQAVQSRAETAYTSEAIDRDWAWSAERSIDVMLREALPAGTVMQEVDCRTSLCRVDLAFSDDATRERFQTDALLTPMSWRGGVLIAHAEPASTQLYLLREGHEGSLSLD